MTGLLIATAVVEAKCMLEGVTEGVTNELVRLFPDWETRDVQVNFLWENC